MKTCLRCNVTQRKLNFAKAIANYDGLQRWCNCCRSEYYKANKDNIAKTVSAYKKKNRGSYNKYHSQRKAAKRNATPIWTDDEHVKSLYLIAAICRSGGVDIHVDHIVPLKSKLVCGLHCETNLQLLPAHVNLSKNNRYWPDMW